MTMHSDSLVSAGGSRHVSPPVTSSGWRQAGLVALPVSAALGPYLLPVPLGEFTLFAYRALVLLLLCGSLLLFSRITWWKIPPARTYALLGLAWVFWAGVGAFWAPSLARAAVEIAALGFGFLTGIALLQLRAYELPLLHAIRRGWVLAFLTTSAVAVWELGTGQHLPPPGGGIRTETIELLITSSFGNPNNYAAFLLLAAPFLVWSYDTTVSYLRRGLYTACLIALPLLVFLTASRVSLLGLAAEVGVLWLLSFRYRVRLVAYVILASALGLVLFQLFGLDLRMADELAALVGGDGVGGTGSVAKRWNLLLAGLWLLLGSGGLGVGPGGFEVLLRQRPLPFDTGGLVNPHNFWIEVLSQYGLPIFVAFITWILYLIVLAAHTRWKSALDPPELETGPVAQVILAGLAGYFFAALANSSYITQSTNWMFWASVVVMVSYLWRRRLVGVVAGEGGSEPSPATMPSTFTPGGGPGSDDEG